MAELPPNQHQLLLPRIANWAAWSTLFLLGGMAWYYYLERTVILDAAYQTFAMIFHDNLAIQVNRFGAAVTKWLPFVAYKWSWSLDTILRLYSVSFIVYGGLLFGWLQWARNQKMALVLIFFYTLLVSHTFYWIQSEQLQGTAMTIWLFGLLLSGYPMKWWHFLLSMPVVVVIVFIHPLTFIPFSFLWCYFWLHQKWYRHWGYYGVLAWFLGVLAYKPYVAQNTNYDELSYSLIDNFWNHYHEVLQLKSTLHFWTFLQTDYYFYPLLLLVLVLFYGIRLKLLKLLLFIGFNVGYFALIHGSFPWGPEQFYIESFYQIFTVFIAVPLVFEVMPWLAKQWKPLLPIVVIGLLASRLIHIGLQRQPYHERLQWNLDMLAHTRQFSTSKFLINEKDIDLDFYLMSWGSAFETLMLSALHHPDSTRTFYIFQEKDINIEESLKLKDTYITPFGPIKGHSLNARYFNFTDTSTYRLLDKEELLPMSGPAQ